MILSQLFFRNLASSCHTHTSDIFTFFLNGFIFCKDTFPNLMGLLLTNKTYSNVFFLIFLHPFVIMVLEMLKSWPFKIKTPDQCLFFFLEKKFDMLILTFSNSKADIEQQNENILYGHYN